MAIPQLERERRMEFYQWDQQWALQVETKLQRLGVDLSKLGFAPLDPREWDVAREALALSGEPAWKTVDLSRCKLYKQITGAYRRVRDIARHYETDWRTAAYIVALDRLETVYRERGIFP